MFVGIVETGLWAGKTAWGPGQCEQKAPEAEGRLRQQER